MLQTRNGDTMNAIVAYKVAYNDQLLDHRIPKGSP